MLDQKIKILDEIKNKGEFFSIIPNINKFWMRITKGVDEIKNAYE